MQVVVDWDGTVTERDTLMHVLRHFVAPAVLDTLEAELDAAVLARDHVTARTNVHGLSRALGPYSEPCPVHGILAP